MKKIIFVCCVALFANFATAQRYQAVVAIPDEPIIIKAKSLNPVVVEFPNLASLGDIYGIKRGTTEDKESRNYMGWSVAKSGNALIVNAMPDATSTTIILRNTNNSTVIDLIVDASAITNKFSITFAGESERAEKLKLEAKQEALEAAAKAVLLAKQVEYEKNPTNKCNYFNYNKIVVRDTDGIEPIKACDDGKLTYFYFKDVHKQPLIYRGYVGEEREALVNQTTLDNGWVMVQGLSKQWNLRLGNNMIAVTRD